MMSPRRAHSCIIWPFYADEAYKEFVCWEIYWCDCKKFEWATCECYFASMPMESALKLNDALKLAKELYRRLGPITIWGITA